jgi:hypothetical protein
VLDIHKSGSDLEKCRSLYDKEGLNFDALESFIGKNTSENDAGDHIICLLYDLIAKSLERDYCNCS